MQDKVGQDAPQLQGAIDIIRQDRAIHLQREAAQQRNRHGTSVDRGLGGLFHAQGLLFQLPFRQILIQISL